MKTAPKISEIREDEHSPLVMVLLEIIRIQQEQIQELRDEIARLKGQKPKPNIKPSVLEKYFENKEPQRDIKKRPGSAKRQKTDNLEIHETVIVKAENVPQGSTFKGYEEFTVQGLRAGYKDYVLNPTALDYMKTQKLPKVQMALLTGCKKTIFEDYTEWKAALESMSFTKKRHIRIATEGALLGSIQEHGSINPDLVILSDDAGQFDVLRRGFVLDTCGAVHKQARGVQRCTA